ncbi:hypothetical protein [Cupriavidus alkaliphilus]|uniref:Uncharacterized protein n=1 Tax=Cupriavidus alkaliphilus TaxID=942866 RepID=A0A7W4VGS8_9BURK|nr:hypothetical protein [Cupriavidus alkaliphilus]MBB3010690.1 hypothetical protein [Cupriavidus alkaliphilus]
MTKKIRRMKNAWTRKEVATLRANWHNGLPIKQWMNELPGRSYSAIMQRAHELELGPRGRCFAVPPTTWTLIQRLLSDGVARTVNAIAAAVGCSGRHVYTTLERYHGAETRIAGWAPRTRNGGDKPAMWALGSGPDARKPRPLSPTEATRRYRKKLRNDPDRMIAREGKDWLRHAERHGNLIRRDQAASWLPTTSNHAPT